MDPGSRAKRKRPVTTKACFFDTQAYSFPNSYVCYTSGTLLPPARIYSPLVSGVQARGCICQACFQLSYYTRIRTWNASHYISTIICPATITGPFDVLSVYLNDTCIWCPGHNLCPFLSELTISAAPAFIKHVLPSNLPYSTIYLLTWVGSLHNRTRVASVPLRLSRVFAEAFSLNLS